MTLAEIDRIAAAPAPSRVGQATAVEQSRAVAEVQAAVVVAQSVPRDVTRAIGEMRDSCGRMGLANRAFYAVKNRGSGPSVHLARELARIWGNLQYGVHELRRDDDAGESEVQAFAWCLQSNTRSTRTFVVPHARMKNGERQRLTDLGDIYLSNQNVGARAVRECIFTLLPPWFTEEAQDLCRATLENGEGTPLQDRIANMVKAFGDLGVNLPQLERKVGQKRGAWTGGTVAELTIAYTSITRDGLALEDVFGEGASPVTAAEITGGAPETPPVDLITDAQQRKLHACMNERGFTDRDLALVFYTETVGREITSSKDLTKNEAKRVIDRLEELAANPDPREEDAGS